MSLVSYLQSKHPDWSSVKCQRIADVIIRKKAEAKQAPSKITEPTLPLGPAESMDDKLANLSTAEDPTVDF